MKDSRDGMEAFLEKVARDQERLREFLEKRASRLARIAGALARTASGANAVHVAGEPPLDRVASLLVAEYLAPLDARELGIGLSPVRMRAKDVVLLLAHEGTSPGLQEVVAAAGRAGALVVFLGSAAAHERVRDRVDLSLALPVRGAKTVSEAALVVARVLMRLARAFMVLDAPDEPEHGLAIVAAAGQGTSAADEAPEAPEAEPAGASVRPRCAVRFALGAFPEDASGPAHGVRSLSSDGVVFELDPEDETGATIEAGDVLWVRLELEDSSEQEHVCMRGRVVSVELAESRRSHVELSWIGE
jgi:hypothetical protein